MKTKRPASRLQTPVPQPAENGSNGERSSVVLGPKDRLVGQLFIEGDLRISGTVEGTLEATGDIEIAGAGKVSGQVTAYNRLVVGGDASLIGGDVRVARLTVEDGATFTGNVSMGQSAVRAPTPVEVGPVAVMPEPKPQPVAVAAVVPVVEPEPVKVGPVKAAPVKAAPPAKAQPAKQESPKKADILKALQQRGKRR